MRNYYLAVDIGASSGRHMLGFIEDGKIKLEEIYRFPNSMENKNGHLCWDLKKLFAEILNGLKKCNSLNKTPAYMGIDTWGVDFVLLDAENNLVGETVGYRDHRTDGMDEILERMISKEELYERTGIQKQIFNTIYQLIAIKNQTPEYLDTAESLLMIPDYFHFLLTGNKKSEYTNATTSQLVNHATKAWDVELIDRIGLPKKIFNELSLPGTIVGEFSEKIKKEVGFSCQVILPPTHDTASSVLAIPTNDENVAYISSGTWSLMGIERKEADCSKESMNANFTNEGGYNYRFRYLKNIMGLWMIQCAKKELKDGYSFADLCQMAASEKIKAIVNCNDSRFLAPQSMIEEVQNFCAESNQQIPNTPGEIAAVIYNSLAKCYESTINELEHLSGKNIRSIHIVGGGANVDYLNQLTAVLTGKKVISGPVESTAIGNLIVQMITMGELSDLEAARNCIQDSFEIKIYEGVAL